MMQEFTMHFSDLSFSSPQAKLGYIYPTEDRLALKELG